MSPDNEESVHSISDYNSNFGISGIMLNIFGIPKVFRYFLNFLK